MSNEILFSKRMLEFERSELDSRESRDVVRALLAERRVEAATLEASELFGPLKGDADTRYTSSLERSLGRIPKWENERFEDAEHDRSQALLAELQRFPLREQRLKVCNDARFQSWAFCERLLAESWKAGLARPKDALELADLAINVAYELAVDEISEPAVCDLKARAWAYLGNARRIASDLRGAEKAFDLADSWVARGSGDPLETARIHEFRASLCADGHRHAEADRLLQRAMRTYRNLGDEHRQGRVMISRGLVCGRSDQAEKAIEMLEAGLARIEPGKEPRLTLVATHNLCFFLNEMGRQDEALARMEALRRLHDRMDNRLDLVRLRWLEGRIALAAGNLEKAEGIFSEVREELIREEMAFDMALVSLDLAGIYARQGRAAEMRKVAREMIPIFQSRDVQREAMAALIVFQEAARIESASVGLIDELSAFLQQSRNEPTKPKA